MGEIIIRGAMESDRVSVAQIIVYSFSGFSRLSKKLDNVVQTLANGIQIDRFLIAIDGDKTMGIAACTDRSGRAININKTDCRKHLGFIVGTISGVVMTAEFSKPLQYPMTTGYIEFVAVAEGARNQGLATKMLRFVMEQTDYEQYMLEVTNENVAAHNCYLKFGFVDVARVKVRFSKLMGFSSKIYMRYTKIGNEKAANQI